MMRKHPVEDLIDPQSINYIWLWEDLNRTTKRYKDLLKKLNEDTTTEDKEEGMPTLRGGPIV